MWSDPPQDVHIRADLKRQAVASGDPGFPDVLVAFHLFRSERRMAQIVHQEK